MKRYHSKGDEKQTFRSKTKMQKEEEKSFLTKRNDKTLKLAG